MTAPLPHELERSRRIRLSVAAYAYEIANTPIMADQMFDWLAERVNKTMGTGHPLMDEFFLLHFSPMTGMWIHQHPELGGIERIFTRYYSVMRDHYDGRKLR